MTTNNVNYASDTGSWTTTTNVSSEDVTTAYYRTPTITAAPTLTTNADFNEPPTYYRWAMTNSYKKAKERQELKKKEALKKRDPLDLL